MEAADILRAASHEAVLQLPPNAHANDVKRSYRRLALLFHPDKNNAPAAADAFLRISEAYQALISKAPTGTVKTPSPAPTAKPPPATHAPISTQYKAPVPPARAPRAPRHYTFSVPTTSYHRPPSPQTTHTHPRSTPKESRAARLARYLSLFSSLVLDDDDDTLAKVSEAEDQISSLARALQLQSHARAQPQARPAFVHARALGSRHAGGSAHSDHNSDCSAGVPGLRRPLTGAAGAGGRAADSSSSSLYRYPVPAPSAPSRAADAAMQLFRPAMPRRRQGQGQGQAAAAQATVSPGTAVTYADGGASSSRHKYTYSLTPQLAAAAPACAFSGTPGAAAGRGASGNNHNSRPKIPILVEGALFTRAGAKPSTRHNSSGTRQVSLWLSSCGGFINWRAFPSASGRPDGQLPLPSVRVYRYAGERVVVAGPVELRLACEGGGAGDRWVGELRKLLQTAVAEAEEEDEEMELVM